LGTDREFGSPAHKGLVKRHERLVGAAQAEVQPHHLVVVSHQKMPALGKSDQLGPCNLAGGVLRTGVSAVAVVTGAENQRWQAQGVQR
jgi:hypothetical protein